MIQRGPGARAVVAPLLGVMASLGAFGSAAQPFEFGMLPEQPESRDSSEYIGREARALVPMLRSEAALAMVEAAQDLPERYTRWVWANADRSNVVSVEAYEELPEADRQGLRFSPVPEQTYYEGVQGWPLSFLRAFDVGVYGTPLGERQGLEGKRVLILGYWSITSARLMASLGADVTAVSDSVLLNTLYDAPKDQGEVESIFGGEPGRVTLVNGAWPGDPEQWRHNAEATRAAVGGGYDLVFMFDSYVAGLARPAAPRRVGGRETVVSNFGVDVPEFAGWLAQALNPGGRVLIYGFGAQQHEGYTTFNGDRDRTTPIRPDEAEAAGLEFEVYDAFDALGMWSYVRLADRLEATTRSGRYAQLRAHYSVLTKPGPAQ